MGISLLCNATFCVSEHVLPKMLDFSHLCSSPHPVTVINTPCFRIEIILNSFGVTGWPIVQTVLLIG